MTARRKPTPSEPPHLVAGEPLLGIRDDSVCNRFIPAPIIGLRVPAANPLPYRTIWIAMWYRLFRAARLKDAAQYEHPWRIIRELQGRVRREPRPENADGVGSRKPS